MTREISQERLNLAWEVLSSEGVRRLPKRNFVVPTIDLQIVKSIVGSNKTGPVSRNLYTLDEFLKKEAIADRFDKDHSARRQWMAEMSHKLGKGLFQRLYENSNQLRLNILSHPLQVISYLRCVIDKTKHPNIFKEIDEIYQKSYSVFDGINPVTGEFDGKDYNDRELEEKLQVVQFIEDRCLEMLNIFSNNS